MISAQIPQILASIFCCFVFGLLFNWLVEWVSKNHIWDVSISVVIGVLVTLIIPSLFFFENWQFMLLLLGCFGASGAPMVIGSVLRHASKEKERKAKRARPLGNTSAKLRDFVLMDMTHLTDDMAEKSKSEKLDPLWIIDWLHRIHVMSRTLKNM